MNNVSYAPGILPAGDNRCTGEVVKIIQTWKCRIKTRPNKGISTPGRTKGENCQTNPIKKFFACNPKAIHHPAYDKWHNNFKKIVMSSRAG